MPTLLTLVALGMLAPALLSTEASATAARDYIWVRALSIPMLFPLIALREAFYVRGDTTTPLRAIIPANLLNLVLNWVSVDLLHWGARGVAFTTVMAVALQLVWLTRVQRPRGFGLREVTPAHIRELLHIGLPYARQKLRETGRSRASRP